MPQRSALIALLLIVASALFAAPARAQTCAFSFTNLSFGTVDVLPGAQIDSTGVFNASCTGITGSNRVRVCTWLNNGTYPPSGTLKQMGNGTSFLKFQIYRNAAYTGVWGPATNQALALTLTRTAPAAVRTAYGRIMASQASTPPGNYASTITASIGWVVYTGTAPACSGVPPTIFQTFVVSAVVQSSCLVSVTNLNFPNVSVIAAPVDAQSTVTVTCTNTTPYHVRLDGGNAGASNPTQRKMSFGAGQITYGLYRNNTRTLGWGSTDGVDTLDSTGTSAAIAHTVYGRIPAQTTPSPGTYTDTVVVTVSFL